MGQKAKLVLKCKRCDYTPDDNSAMEEFQLHMNLEHDTSEVEMELIPKCLDHDVFLRFVESKPTGGGFKDYYYCPIDNAELFIKRGE